MDIISVIEANWALVLAAAMIIPLTFGAWSRWNVRTIMFFLFAVASLLADGFTNRNMFLAVMFLPLIFIAWKREVIPMLAYDVLMIALIAGV